MRSSMSIHHSFFPHGGARLHSVSFAGGTASVAMRETVARIGKPVIALFGALIFVSLLMVGGERASTIILGDALASVTGGAWKYFAPFLGALGSFFSGSTTISNLTFGGIRLQSPGIGIDPGTLLALSAPEPPWATRFAFITSLPPARSRDCQCRRRDPQASFSSVILYGIILAAAAALLF